MKNTLFSCLHSKKIKMAPRVVKTKVVENVAFILNILKTAGFQLCEH